MDTKDLNSVVTSVSINIAEGKGRYSKKEFVQFLYFALGSLCETISLFKIVYKRNWIEDAQLDKLKDFRSEISKMILSLIRSIKLL